MPPALDDVPAQTWKLLAARQDVWRTPVLASATPDGGGDARIVVLRAVSAEHRELTFFTDLRSRKCAQLESSPEVCLLVYDVKSAWQVRLYGRARRESDQQRLDDWWHDLGDHQRAHYAVDAGNGKGRDNFAAFHVTVNHFHCLWLHDGGNEAAEFMWRNGDWGGRFVRP